MARSNGFLSFITLVLLGWLLHSDLRSRSRAAFEEDAKLDQNIDAFIADGVTLDQALDHLAKKTGARITRSPTIRARTEMGFHWMLKSNLAWQTPVYARLYNVSLRAALQELTEQASDQFVVPLTFAACDDGSIFVGADDEMPFVVRAYDLRGLYHLLDHHLIRAEVTPYFKRFYSSDGYPDYELDVLFDEQTISWDAYRSLPAPYFFDGRLIRIGPRRQQRQTQRLWQQVRVIREPWRGPYLVHLHLASDFDYWKPERKK